MGAHACMAPTHTTTPLPPPQAQLGGNASPSEADVKKILSSGACGRCGRRARESRRRRMHRGPSPMRATSPHSAPNGSGNHYPLQQHASTPYGSSVRPPPSQSDDEGADTLACATRRAQHAAEHLRLRRALWLVHRHACAHACTQHAAPSPLAPSHPPSRPPLPPRTCSGCGGQRRGPDEADVRGGRQGHCGAGG